jgi:hypothetical protein
VNGQFHVWPLYSQRKGPREELDRMFGRREEEKILDPTGTSTLTLGRAASSQSLYRLRLRYVSCNKSMQVKDKWEERDSVSSRSMGL